MRELRLWYVTIEVNEMTQIEDRLVGEKELRELGHTIDPLMFEVAFFLDPNENGFETDFGRSSCHYHRAN